MRLPAKVTLALFVACTPRPATVDVAIERSVDAGVSSAVVVADSGVADSGIADSGVADGRSSSPYAARTAPCPSAFSLAPNLSCVIAGARDGPCVFPEGTCNCVDGPHCGGALRQPAIPGERGQLRCWPNDPTMRRPDGCTFSAPTATAACAPEGKVCTYGECAWNQTIARCTTGKWSVKQSHGPKPP